MKIILSRKGFDSQYGGQPSPILPDGTLLSFPIPSSDNVFYKDLDYNGLSYLDLITSLNSHTNLNENSRCHLDPDIYPSVIARKKGWKAAFGQTGSSLTELRKYDVTTGDLFLFFGWFRETEYYKGKLRYRPKAPDLHVIFGYMQIGEIIDDITKIPDWLKSHPHANLEKYSDAWEKRLNAIFLPTDKLSFAPNLNGSGTFNFKPSIILTKEGYSRSRWQFPESMQGIPISHNPNGWKKDYFQSAARGQEFILSCNDAVLEWIMPMFEANSKR